MADIGGIPWVDDEEIEYVMKEIPGVMHHARALP
jgi:hypothetical protein